jgi:hypothetical protein
VTKANICTKLQGFSQVDYMTKLGTHEKAPMTMEEVLE